MTVRTATPADVPAIADLELDNLGTDAWSEGLVREGVTGNLPTISYLVAEVEAGDGRRVVGHATASVVADIAELQRIAVDAHHRRHGVASDLLQAVVDLAHAGGADRLLLAEDAAGQPIGTASAGRIYMHGPTFERWWLGVWVPVEARQHGIGDALYRAASDAARAAGKTGFQTEVSEAHADGMRFLTARGFVEIDRRARYYRDGTTAVVLRRGLVRGCGGRSAQ